MKLFENYISTKRIHKKTYVKISYTKLHKNEKLLRIIWTILFFG